MTRFPKALLVLALAGVGAAASAAEITVSVYSAFTTLDPYDASDTLSQNVAKSFLRVRQGHEASERPRRKL